MAAMGGGKDTYSKSKIICMCVPFETHTLEIAPSTTTVTRRTLFECIFGRSKTVIKTKDVSSFGVKSKRNGFCDMGCPGVCSKMGTVNINAGYQTGTSAMAPFDEAESMARSFLSFFSLAHYDTDQSKKVFEKGGYWTPRALFTCKITKTIWTFTGLNIDFHRHDRHCLCACIDETRGWQGSRIPDVMALAHYIPKGFLSCGMSPSGGCRCEEQVELGLKDQKWVQGPAEIGQSSSIVEYVHSKYRAQANVQAPEQTVQVIQGTDFIFGTCAELTVTTDRLTVKTFNLPNWVNCLTLGCFLAEQYISVRIEDIKLVECKEPSIFDFLTMGSEKIKTTMNAAECSIGGMVTFMIGLMVGLYAMTAGMIMVLICCLCRQSYVSIQTNFANTTFRVRPSTDLGTDVAGVADNLAKIIHDLQAQKASNDEHSSIGAAKHVGAVAIDMGSAMGNPMAIPGSTQGAEEGQQAYYGNPMSGRRASRPNM